MLHLDSNGQLLWGSYYGGSGDEGAETHNLALTDDDELVVAMFTSSSNLPGAQNAASDGAAGFVAVLGSGGSSLQAARYLDGSAADEVEGVDARDDSNGVPLEDRAARLRDPSRVKGFVRKDWTDDRRHQGPHYGFFVAVIFTELPPATPNSTVAPTSTDESVWYREASAVTS